MTGSVPSADETVVELRRIAARAEALLELPIDDKERKHLSAVVVRANSFAQTIESQPPEQAAAIMNMSGGASAMVSFVGSTLTELEAKYAD